MTWETILQHLLDALKDSALAFLFVFLAHVVLSFFENKLKSFLIKKKEMGPVFGSIFGLIPQCGTSVLGADLYISHHITMGTLIAIFLSCSDEAFILLLTSGDKNKILSVLPLMGLKLLIGMFVGIVVDLLNKNQQISDEQLDSESSQKESKLQHHLIHPLLHSLTIFAYIFVINCVLNLLIGFIGEENFMNFMVSNRYLTPLYCSIIGLIPNCASSILITELFIGGSISFGSLLAGLLVNSGLGAMLLLKNIKMNKNSLIIISICFVSALISGYLTCLISGF